MVTTQQIIDSLKPSERPTVMDLVEASGINVSDWANYKGRHPASNPKYCYEWVFSGNSVITACLWHSNLVTLPDGRVGQHLNLWNVAKRHEQSGPRSIVATRARSLDHALQTLHHSKGPLRVIIVDGEQADLEAQDAKSSKVSRRLLDTKEWHVASYDFSTGDCVVVRGSAAPAFVDQFETMPLINVPVEQSRRETNVYSRSASVRLAALTRANGHCELCGEKGFTTTDGSIYLETHHVVPLSEGGADSTSNVVALCPLHHREAHFGGRRREIAEELIAYLGRVSNNSFKPTPLRGAA